MERITTVVFHPANADALVDAMRGDPRLASLDPTAVRDRAELGAALRDAVVLVTTNGVPPEALDGASALRWIHVAAAGVDGVVRAPIPEGVRITRTRGTFGPRMTEYVCAHLLALAQDVHGFRAQQHTRVWRTRPVEHLRGRTVGVVGVGNIGGVVAERLAQFGMRVVGLSRNAGDHPAVERWFTPAERLAFARETDVVVVTLPLTEATRGFVDAPFLAALPRGAWVLNVGRGPVIDEAALVDALQRGHVGAAVLDVFEHEPLDPSSPLWTLPNVVVTPHQAGDAIVSEVVDAVAANVDRWRDPAPLDGEVDRSRSY